MAEQKTLKSQEPDSLDELLKELDKPEYLHVCRGKDEHQNYVNLQIHGDPSFHPDLNLHQTDISYNRKRTQEENEQLKYRYEKKTKELANRINELQSYIPTLKEDGWYARNFKGSPNQKEKERLTEKLNQLRRFIAYENQYFSQKMEKGTEGINLQKQLFPNETLIQCSNYRKPQFTGVRIGNSFVYFGAMGVPDSRGSLAPTYYYLAIPADKIDEIVPKIEKNPEILNIMFSKYFPVSYGGGNQPYQSYELARQKDIK